MFFSRRKKQKNTRSKSMCFSHQRVIIFIEKKKKKTCGDFICQQYKSSTNNDMTTITI